MKGTDSTAAPPTTCPDLVHTPVTQLWKLYYYCLCKRDFFTCKCSGLWWSPGRLLSKSTSLRSTTNFLLSPSLLLFFCSVFMCFVAGHPAAGTTLHLQKLALFLRQSVR